MCNNGGVWFPLLLPLTDFLRIPLVNQVDWMHLIGQWCHKIRRLCIWRHTLYDSGLARLPLSGCEKPNLGLYFLKHMQLVIRCANITISLCYTLYRIYLNNLTFSLSSGRLFLTDIKHVLRWCPLISDSTVCDLTSRYRVPPIDAEDK
jgi:hypothetical protein